jgi:DNA polymerase
MVIDIFLVRHCPGLWLALLWATYNRLLKQKRPTKSNLLVTQKAAPTVLAKGQRSEIRGPQSNSCLFANKLSVQAVVASEHKATYLRSGKIMNSRLNLLSKRIRACRACDLSQTRTHALPGAGNDRARLMIIAQAPGEHEDLEERHFIGPSGRVFDQLLSNARVSRNELFLTNLLKCRLPKNRRPRQREIKACLPFLQEEVAIVDPEILVSLGFYATRSVLYLNNIQFPQAKSDSAQFFGRLFWQGQKKVYPLPHPASLLYSPSFQHTAEQQYAKLKILSAPCKWYGLCPMRRFYEQGCLDRSWIELYCTGDWSRCVRFEKEEQGIPHPDWMLPDGTLDSSLRALD